MIVSTHPRARKKIESSNLNFDKNILLYDPFSFTDYCNLQINSRCVLSDSGTISEESSILNFPAINLRIFHERPEGTEEASVISVGLNLSNIFNAIRITDSQLKGENRSLKIVDDYDVDNVSEKISRIILGNIDLVRQDVWRENQ